MQIVAAFARVTARVCVTAGAHHGDAERQDGIAQRDRFPRAHNNAALTRSVDPLLRSRGYAGLKDVDTDIRRIIAEQLELNPHESHVSPLLGLLSDASPEVRAAAVT